MRLTTLLALTLSCLGWPHRAGAQAAAPIPVLPVSVAVAEVEGRPVVDQAWLDAQISRANRIFGTHGVTFRLIERRPLAERYAKLETRRDRHALGAQMKAKVINWFVVSSLRDVDDPSLYRRGVHWRPQGFPGKHLVVTSKIASELVLAHELGHFFGNREHSPVPGNIMSYSRGEGEPFFDPIQTAKVLRFARRFLRTKELLPADELGGRP